MKTNFLTLIVCVVLMFLCGCNKENINIEEGVYKGTFTFTYVSVMQTGQTTLVLKDGKYSCTGNRSRIPAGGSGTYTINKNKIIFEDENIWLHQFYSNLILDGEYNYQLDGKKLRISAIKNNVEYYDYDLEKQ